MPFTSIAEFEATESPTTAERALIAACKSGTPCYLPDGNPETATLPPEGEPTPNRHIRAELLRLLILGGTQDCGLDPVGVALVGAQITGTLDLSFTKTRGRLVLGECRFDEAPNLFQAQIAALALSDSHLPGLFAQRIKVEGSLFLRGLTATGIVDVTGAKIDGQLDCEGATLNGAGGTALNAQGVQVGQGLFLRGLTATGTVAVNGANIGGQLACDGATLDGAEGKALNAQGVQVGQGLFLRDLTATGTVDLSTANIGGQLACDGATLNGAGGKALNAQWVKVTEAFIFRGLQSVTGKVDLTSAHVGDLWDDENSWPNESGQLDLDAFTYDRISGAPLTLAARAGWLATGSRFKGTFTPQPCTQFARVLREMGHVAEARKVLMARDRLLFAESHKANLMALNAAKRENQGAVEKAWLRHRLLLLWDWFTFTASGYGHAPQRALGVALFCIGVGAVLFALAWYAGVMVPNSAIVLTSPDWRTAMASTPDAPAQAWTALQPGRHYETFYGLPYALDVFVPFVSLGQEQAWAATTTTGFGFFVRWFTFAYQIAGWAVTALGIAAITGFVQKNQPE